MPNETIELNPNDSHYIRDVLRLEAGDSIEIGQRGAAGVFHGEIVSTGERISVRLLEKLPEGPQEASLSLICALCKGQKNEQIVDWATELGASQIVFFQAERSVVRLRSTEECDTKRTRLSKIATAAAQQSRQATPPELRVARSLEEALAQLPTSSVLLKAICSLAPEAMPLAMFARKITPESHVCLVIGPEGDLSPDEHARLMSLEFVPTSLGPKVLRSELAVVTAIATLRAAQLGA